MSNSSETKPKRLFLLDGSALAYRAYFAFIRNPLVNSKGVNTSGVFGFTNTLLKILKDEHPDYIACVFDTPEPTFRHRVFPEYKATREKMPDELVVQLPAIREVVSVFRIPLIEMAGFEADDVMGTLATQAEEGGIETYLVTGDKDFMQLISPSIKMYTLSKGGGGSEPEIIDPDAVKAKWGVGPENITDLLGLMGDASDNIPGVPGIGPKTAQELINQFGSLESALDRIQEIKKEGLRNNLYQHRQQALFSKDLATIRTDVPVLVSITSLVSEGPDHTKVIPLFKDLEFNKFLRDLAELKIRQPGKSESERKYRTLLTDAQFDAFLKEINRIPMFALDLETTSLDAISAEIVGLSFCWKEGEAFYIPLLVPENERPMDLFAGASNGRSSDSVLRRLKPILENPNVKKCGQNIKYDMLVLRRHNVQVQGVDFDSMIAAYLVNPTARQFGIDALALEYLHMQKIPTKSLIGAGQKQIRMDQVQLEKVAEYACEDADAAFQLRHVLEPKLSEIAVDKLFREVEMPLVRVLMEMEENGVSLDTRLLASMSADMESQLNRIQNDIYEIAGERFNINSTQQLGKILFEKLKVHELVGWKRPKRTKTGYATDVSILEGLSGHPLPQKLLEYRQLAKLKSTYVDALPKLINPKTGRLHASFNQTVTATGRLSSSDPNLQNIPIRTDLGREIRKAFIPAEKGQVILSADYNQIELRIMAHLSGDETLMDSFRKGEDVHKRTASEIFGIPPEAVDDAHRRDAKTINFGIMYGMGVFGLSDRLGISQEEAQQFITAYFARYPKVNEYITRTIALAYKQGFVTTLLNRRRYLPELKSDNRNLRDFAERTAINTPIQGTAADLIKIAMIRIADHLREPKWKAKMILQIHDELVFEAPEGEIVSLSEMVKEEMEGAIRLSVPIKVDVGTGKNWFEAH
jgi:DNA polymerase-1